MTHLWVVTADDADTIRRLPTRLIRPLKTHFGELAERRVFIANDVKSVFSTTDERKIAELLYRLVLHGEGWRSTPGGRRCFSIHLTGARNVFAANLLRAATFFEVDYIVQLLFDAVGGKPPPDDLPSIERRTEEYYPIFMDEERSPWPACWTSRGWMSIPGGPWRRRNFALRDWDKTEDDWIRTFPHEDAKSLALTEGLKKIAVNTKKFADRALSCGVGPHFLTHDLQKLVDDLRLKIPDDGSDIRLFALSEYLVGLSEVIDDEPLGSSGLFAAARFPDLCDRGAYARVRPSGPSRIRRSARVAVAC